MERLALQEPYRRGSHGKDETRITATSDTDIRVLDETTIPHHRRFLIQVEPTLESLLAQEDPDRNMQITIEDSGPKVSRVVSKGA